jgi:hypothetical protein
MKIKNKKHELALIASIMSHRIGDGLFVIHNMPFIASNEIIVDWAIEFQKIHKGTDWEHLLNSEDVTIKTISTAFVNEIIETWDDAIEDYALYKLETYENDTKN